jgi:hypothetical protein
VTRALTLLLALLAVVPGAASAAEPVGLPPPAQIGRFDEVHIWTIHYRAHDGLLRRAFVVLPRWYGPNDHPPLPLVISPHGRGVPAIDNVRNWGNLPRFGRFALVCPEGQGRRLTLYSWGDPGEIDDLSKMPGIVRAALPWLRVDESRIYSFGSSQGGQETLLLVGEYPQVLAGAAAFDSPTRLAERYYAFAKLRFGLHLQALARLEIGGPPWGDPRAYAIRSPLDWARQIAFSGVPLQIWWSRKDRIVVDQNQESGALYRDIKRLNPHAPVIQVVGYWRHSAEFKATRRLPHALALFGLFPPFRDHAAELPRPTATSIGVRS